MAHEWGHYLSNRLIGDANGLTSKQAAGLGEGWGDFLALLVTVNEQDRLQNGNGQFQGAYAQGAYAASGHVYPALDENNAAYFGSRRYPYSTDMRKNPLTFKHIQDGESLPEDVERNPKWNAATDPLLLANSQLHNTGEVWASMLWECYAGMLNGRPFSEAQQRMRNYLVAGMKLTPVLPTLLEARDALLAVVAASDSQDYASCLAGFAKRGAGLDAVGPPRLSMNNQGVVESYGMGPLLVVDEMTLSVADPVARSCDGDTVLDNTETGALRIQLVNRGNSTIQGVTLALQASDERIAFPNGATILVNDVMAPGQRLDVVQPVYLSGMSEFGYARIDVQPGTSDARIVTRGKSAGFWLHADIRESDSSTDAVDIWPGGMRLDDSWAISGEAGEHWYELSMPNQRTLVAMSSPEIHVSAVEDLIVTFDHQFDFGADAANGGQLVVSRAHFLDEPAGDGVLSNSGRIWSRKGDASNNNPLRGQAAYVGHSEGWKRNVVVNLGRRYAGQVVRIGWRAGAANGANPGSSQFWRVDNIRLSGADNQPFASIQTNEKTCTQLLAVHGTAQSATPGVEFAEPLVVQLADVSGIPVAKGGVPVSFEVTRVETRGAAGAGVGFATGGAASVLTDANGRAQAPPLRSHSPSGDFLVVASAGQSGTVQFALHTADGEHAVFERSVAGGSGEESTSGRSVARPGQKASQSVTAVPTLSHWTLMMLATLLCAVAAYQLNRMTSES